MFCKNCNLKKHKNKFRKNRKTCVKCEYTKRKEYFKKYQKDNKERLNEYNRIYQKSKNYYYKPRERKPKIKKRVPKINNKNLDLNITFDIYI